MSEEMKKESPSLVEQKINALNAERQALEDYKEAKHKEGMENSVEYRRNYYQNLLYNEFKMHPEDQYHKDEYEVVVKIYNKHFDQMDKQSTVEELEATLNHARKKFKRVLGKEKIFKYVFSTVCTVLILAVVLAVILAYTI